MRKAIRTTLTLVVSLVLSSALTMAHGNNADKDKRTKHHSRLAKLAFWHHHSAADKNAKQAHATQAPSKRAPHAKTAQMKPASAKQAASKQDQAGEASNKSKPSAQKAPAANKTKPHPATVSSKQ